MVEWLIKTTGTIEKALWDVVNNYSPEYSKIKVPTLSIYVIWDYYPYYLPEYLTKEQKAATINLIDTAYKHPFKGNVSHNFVVRFQVRLLLLYQKGIIECLS